MADDKLITLDVKGDKTVMLIMKILSKMSGGKMRVGGAAFHGTERKDGKGGNNADVAKYLQDQQKDIGKDRDFFTAGPKVSDKASEVFAVAVDKQIQELINKEALTERTSSSGKRKSLTAVDEAKASKLADQLAGKGYLAAIEVWRQEIVRRIENGETVNGQADKVIESYAKWRKKEYSVAEDKVGTATGDLLTNLADERAAKVTSGKV